LVNDDRDVAAEPAGGIVNALGNPFEFVSLALSDWGLCESEARGSRRKKDRAHQMTSAAARRPHYWRRKTDSSFKSFSYRAGSWLFSSHSYSRSRVPSRRMIVVRKTHGLVSTFGSSIVA